MALTKIDDRGLTTPIDLLDNEKIRFGTGNDGEIYFDGTDSIFTSAGKFRFKHGTDTAIKTLVDGGVYLSHDNSIKFYTTASGIFVGGHIDLDDNSELQIGTGDDLKIYHNGTHSEIADAGTGDLRLLTNKFKVLNNPASADENMIVATENGAVELYYNGTKKLETTANGVNITGGDAGGSYIVGDMYWDNGTNAGRDVHWDQSANTWNYRDDVKVTIGNGNDLLLMHDGTDNIIDAQNNASIRIRRGGYNVWEFGDASFKGNDNRKIILGDGSDLQIYHNGSDSYIDDQGTGQLRLCSNELAGLDAAHSDYTFKAIANGAVELYYDNVKRFETTSYGNSVFGHFDIATDSDILRMGGSYDLQIYHDGGNNWVDSVNNHPLICRAGTGILYLQGGEVKIGNEGNSEKYITAVQDGSVDIYYNNIKTIETISGGSRFTGLVHGFTDEADALYGTNYSFHKFQQHVNNWTLCAENSNNTAPYGFLIKFSDTAPDNNVEAAISFADNAATRFTVYSDGDANTSDAGTLTSDETLKENITDATSKLEDIKKLKVRNYNWKASYHPEKSKTKQIGFIAQEVEEVFPALVKEYDISPDIGIEDHTPIMKKAIKSAWDPIIIKALQELITKVETLEAKVAALEAG